METPPPDTFNLGYVGAKLVQKNDSGEQEEILTASAVEDAVRGTPLTGLSTADDSPIGADSTVLEGFGQLQAQVDEKLDAATTYSGGKKSEFFHESDGGGYRFTDSTAGTTSFVGLNDSPTSAVKGEIYAINSSTKVGSRLIQTLSKTYYTSGNADSSFTANDELATQADVANLVPDSRTVNAKALSANVTLTTDDISEGTTNLYHLQSDFAQTDSGEPDFIKNKPALQDGHTILNPSGTALTQRGKLRFQGDGVESVADDAINDTTIVTIEGGGEEGMTNPMTAKGDLIVGVDATGSPGKLSAGTAGQVLTVNAASSDEPLGWKTPFTNPITTIGDLIAGGTAGATTRLAAGTSGQMLAVTSTGALAWTTPFVSPMTAAGDLIVGAASGVASRLAAGSVGQVLSVTSTGTLGWINSSSGMTNPMTAEGDLIVGGSGGTPTRLARAQYYESILQYYQNGVIRWITPPWMENPMDGQGQLISGGASGEPYALAKGNNGDVLTAGATYLSWTKPVGFANPMTDVGLMILGWYGGEPYALEPGSIGQVLTIGPGGYPIWANPTS